MWSEWRSRLFREKDSGPAAADGVGVSSVFSDPALVKRPAVHGALLGDLRARGIVGFSSARPAAVGIFSVSNMDRSRRMICDTRAANDLPSSCQDCATCGWIAGSRR
eukprot:9416876-Pyramimonas_sp.AAC.1